MAHMFTSKEGGPRKVQVNLLEQPKPNIEEQLEKIETLLADMKVSKSNNEGDKHYENFRGALDHPGNNRNRHLWHL